MHSSDLPTGVSTASAVLFFLQTFPPIWLTLSALLGLSVGSFLNVVIYRLPIMLKNAPDQPRLNLCFPSSHCPHCGHDIAMKDNIPVFGYLRLRGRCRHCQTRISPRYPLVECFTGCLCVASAWLWGPTWTCMVAWLSIWTCITVALMGWDKRQQAA